MNIPFLQPGPPISEADVSAVERRLGIVFPAEYRDFLLTHNGGEVEPLRFSFVYDDGEPGDAEVTSFQSIGVEDGLNDLEGTVFFQRDELDLPNHLIPIAFCDEDEILLAVAGDDAGKVYLWYIIESGFDGSHFQRVADSFQQFLKALQPSE